MALRWYDTDEIRAILAEPPNYPDAPPVPRVVGRRAERGDYEEATNPNDPGRPPAECHMPGECARQGYCADGCQPEPPERPEWGHGEQAPPSAEPVTDAQHLDDHIGWSRRTDPYLSTEGE